MFYKLETCYFQLRKVFRQTGTITVLPPSFHKKSQSLRFKNRKRKSKNVQTNQNFPSKRLATHLIIDESYGRNERNSKLHKMGCCLSKTEENQDKMFDPNTCPNEYEEIQESNQTLINEAGSFAAATETNIQSGECDYEEPRKARQWVERIETNKDRIVLSVDPEASDEKIVKDREETLLEYGRSFLLE